MSPAHVLLSPTDDNNLINISDFSKIGLSSIKESSAFKKIQYHSKSPASQLFDSSTINYSRFDVLSSLYDNNSTHNNAKDYYTDRQDNYSSLLVSQLNSSSNLETSSVNRFLDYNFNMQPSNNTNSSVAPNNYIRSTTDSQLTDLNNSSRLATALSTFNFNSDVNHKFIELSQNSLNINSTSDGKYYNNPMKVALSPSNSRRLALNLPVNSNSDLNTSFETNEITAKFSNLELSSKFKDLKSGNMSFLSPDKNTRLINKLHTNKGQLNFSHETSNLDDVLNRINLTATSENEIYNSANSAWVSPVSLNKTSALNIATGSSNSPVYSNNPS
jgi:hypothetical protein